MYVLALKQQTLPPYTPLAEAEIGDHQLELGRLIGTGRPLVIDWRTEHAWVGTWEDLAQVAIEVFREEGIPC